ncbi:MAG: metallophosphoesterase, partial [Bacteroidetes bacterium]|nr:metallophosphoesterase [Bacteroidota bacterium]
PTLGKPLLIGDKEIAKHSLVSLLVEKNAVNKKDAVAIFSLLLNGHLFLRSVRDNKQFELIGEMDKLTMKTVDPNPLFVNKKVKGYSLNFRLPVKMKLEEKSMYDICITLPNGTKQTLSPHCIYVRNSWTDFKFIHATDIHVSRRTDTCRAKLKAGKHDTAADHFVNFSDGFRKLIQFANNRYLAGELDFIMITGDLVDYVFEGNHPRRDGALKSVSGNMNYFTNNFVFFEELVTGTASENDEIATQELKVPIFTSLGNHDYRTVPYNFINNVLIDDVVKDQFKSWADDAANGIPTPIDDYIIKGGEVVLGGLYDLGKSIVNGIADLFHKKLELTYGIPMCDVFNLSDTEGSYLVNRTDPSITSAEARQMITPDENNKMGWLDYYFRYINKLHSYRVELGKHDLVMIDGKWDRDVPDDVIKTLAAKWGFGSESSVSFAHGLPNSVGFFKGELQLVNDALKRNGLVIIGVHQPLINLKDREYPFFLRESIRSEAGRAFDAEMLSYLFDRSKMSFLKEVKETLITKIDPGSKFASGWQRGDTSYFYAGDGNELLDAGVMTKYRTDFLKACAGLSKKRAADLILSGHVHVNWECRIELSASKKQFRFYTDFYTENPKVYYNTNFRKELSLTSDSEKARVIVTTKGSADPKPKHNAKNEWVFNTILNKNSLEFVKYQNAKEWWNKRKPLFIQTCATGPIERQRGSAIHQPDLRGCRVITVRNNIISKINYVYQEQIDKSAKIKAGKIHDHRTPLIGKRTLASKRPINQSGGVGVSDTASVSGSATVHDHRNE